MNPAAQRETQPAQPASHSIGTIMELYAQMGQLRLNYKKETCRCCDAIKSKELDSIHFQPLTDYILLKDDRCEFPPEKLWFDDATELNAYRVVDKYGQTILQGKIRPRTVDKGESLILHTFGIGEELWQ